MPDVVSTLIGVAVGFALNEIAGWARHARTVTEERRAARTLLRLECQQNLAVLKEFWDKVTTAAYLVQTVAYLNEELEFHKRLRLVSLPPPAWSHLMWASQAGSLAKALRQSELESVFWLYMSLDTFISERSKVDEFFTTDDGKMLAAEFEDWIDAKRLRGTSTKGTVWSDEKQRKMTVALMPFNTQTATAWNECQGIYNRVQQYGNPIGDDIPVRRPANWRKRLLKWRQSA